MAAKRIALYFSTTLSRSTGAKKWTLLAAIHSLTCMGTTILFLVWKRTVVENAGDTVKAVVNPEEDMEKDPL